MFVEPRANAVVLLFLVGVELSLAAQSPKSVKHSELRAGILVNIGRYKSQVHV